MTFKFVAPPKFSALSTRYVKCWVSAMESGVQIDPTVGTAQFAFVADGVTPGVSDWKAGTWESTGFEYLARCLVGPNGTVSLAVGTYDVWIQYTKSPETIVEHIGHLFIY